MHTEVKFGPLPDEFRAVIERAEHAAHLTYANAICHAESEYDAEHDRAHAHYAQLCHQVAVCCCYQCYERTTEGIYCDTHLEGHAIGE